MASPKHREVTIPTRRGSKTIHARRTETGRWVTADGLWQIVRDEPRIGRRLWRAESGGEIDPRSFHSVTAAIRAVYTSEPEREPEPDEVFPTRRAAAEFMLQAAGRVRHDGSMSDDLLGLIESGRMIDTVLGDALRYGARAGNQDKVRLAHRLLASRAV